MYLITATEMTTLGYAGENEARAVVFTYPQEWIDEYPNGELKVHVKRAGDGAVYTATDVEDDRDTLTLTWTITDDETSFSGTGEAQLCLIDNGVVVKSQRYGTVVNQSTAAVTPTDPPPDTIIEQAVEDYLRDYVDVITISDHGEDGQILQSNGDGSYSWLTVDNTIIDSDSGDTLVPTRTLNRLAQVIRQKTGYEGDMSIETMAEVLEQTDMWTTEEYCLNLAPAAAELTITLGSLPQYALYGRQNISKVVLPYCGRIRDNAFTNSALSILVAPNVSVLGGYVFSACSNLIRVEMDRLTQITSTQVFSSCSALQSIRLPALKTMHGYTFNYCTSLESVSLPEVDRLYGDNLNNADNNFYGDTLLQTVEMPKMTRLRNNNFTSCVSLKTLELPSLQYIGANNFTGCTALETVKLPSCLSWGNANFTNCNSLRRMCFYTKATSISNTLFSGAPVLQDIYVSWGQGEVAGAPWGAPAGCTVHYDTQYDEDGEPIV